MARFSYHVSHEQFSPRDLLHLVRRAEERGFDAAFSSDHFMPWAETQGHSGNAWVWLGAAMQATRFPFGILADVPGVPPRRRQGKAVRLKVDLCWARTEEEALAQAHAQWRFNAVGPEATWDLRTPEAFEQVARFVRPEDMRAMVRISADPAQHVAWLSEYADLGVESIDLHHVGLDQAGFIDTFGEAVLPALRRAGARG